MSRAAWAGLVPQPRAGIIKHLSRQAPEFAGTEERVLLCFHTDPYQPVAAATGVTREALRVLRDHQIPFTVLTKAGLAAVADFPLYSRRDLFGATMTFLRAGDSRRVEPGAPLPLDRARALLEAHEAGIETFVSLEPVLDPAQSLEIIDWTHEYVDHYRIGKINHAPEIEAGIDWCSFAYEAVNRCEKYDRPYLVKKDLLALCDFPVNNLDTRKVSTPCPMKKS
jgi:DNA repair photolyase